MSGTASRLTPPQRRLARAFEEWERQYRADPNSFATVAERLAGGPVEYGVACAVYLTELLRRRTHHSRKTRKEVLE